MWGSIRNARPPNPKPVCPCICSPNENARVYLHILLEDYFIWVRENALKRTYCLQYVYFLDWMISSPKKDFIFMVALAQKMQQIGFIITGGGGRGVGGTFD